MSNLRNAAQQALDAWDRPHGINYIDFRPYMDALRAALAEPVQEPVAHTLNCVCGAVWDIKADGSEEMAHTPDTAQPQRKPLTDEEIEMNPRIQALADEAEDYADGIVDQGGEFHPAYTRKLAELIVRECAKRSGELGNPELGQGLMKHFGVEE